MTSSRPYVIRAMYQWIQDNGDTVHILVNAENPEVEVPEGSGSNGQIVLNLSPGASRNLILGNEVISFIAGFKGVKHDLKIPVSSVMAIYSSETGEGMFLDDLPEVELFRPENPVVKTTVKSTPSLRIVK